MLRHARIALRLAAVLVLASSSEVWAQTHGDVKPSVIQGRLVVDESNFVPVAVATGYKIFEGNLGDLYGGPLKTNGPGFVAAPGTFQSGEQLWYQAIGTLGFWNGTNWGVAPDDVSLKLADALGSDTLITAAGVTNPLGVIDAADSSGGIHRHLDFSVSDPAGSYLATFQLVSRDASSNLPPPYLDSDPFHIVLNRGLSDAAFEASITALTVPEPETYAMFLAGLAIMGYMARQRSRERLIFS
ncbi:PEP-CTERM sorting domain-containing protein [Nitrosospira multiformis]|uniref:PEP-CTERM protein-sorting domain-containing protein n=1 Tax=Nitrosospira multiformis TaxID=1231 RepID=A0A1I7HDF9_9PROT|nr:PEP-CTERM sorting domain-containing protein [Nitrosospira multiformis]SFU58755.1 PEP-CTERM protein-sorting domain-containing protein [Nitrosospira multiformis]